MDNDIQKIHLHNSSKTTKIYIHVSQKSLQKMMAPSLNFKNKRDKPSPIQIKNPISRDKSE